MTISIDLPGDLEETLRQRVADLEREAKEALLIDLYRQRKITESQLGGALGLARSELDGLLLQHGVFHELTAEQVSQEGEVLRRFREQRADRR